MFKRHVYTCPDVIHMRKINRRNIILALVPQAIIWGGLAVWARTQEDRINLTEIIEEESAKSE